MPVWIRPTSTRLALVRWLLASDLTRLASRAGSETLWRNDLLVAPMPSLYTKSHHFAPRRRRKRGREAVGGGNCSGDVLIVASRLQSAARTPPLQRCRQATGHRAGGRASGRPRCPEILSEENLRMVGLLLTAELGVPVLFVFLILQL